MQIEVAENHRGEPVLRIIPQTSGETRQAEGIWETWGTAGRLEQRKDGGSVYFEVLLRNPVPVFVLRDAKTGTIIDAEQATEPSTPAPVPQAVAERRAEGGSVFYEVPLKDLPKEPINDFTVGLVAERYAADLTSEIYRRVVKQPGAAKPKKRK